MKNYRNRRYGFIRCAGIFYLTINFTPAISFAAETVQKCGFIQSLFQRAFGRPGIEARVDKLQLKIEKLQQKYIKASGGEKADIGRVLTSDKKILDLERAKLLLIQNENISEKDAISILEKTAKLPKSEFARSLIEEINAKQISSDELVGAWRSSIITFMKKDGTMVAGEIKSISDKGVVLYEPQFAQWDKFDFKQSSAKYISFDNLNLSDVVIGNVTRPDLFRIDPKQIIEITTEGSRDRGDPPYRVRVRGFDYKGNVIYSTVESPSEIKLMSVSRIIDVSPDLGEFKFEILKLDLKRSKEIMTKLKNLTQEELGFLKEEVKRNGWSWCF